MSKTPLLVASEHDLGTKLLLSLLQIPASKLTVSWKSDANLQPTVEGVAKIVGIVSTSDFLLSTAGNREWRGSTDLEKKAVDERLRYAADLSGKLMSADAMTALSELDRILEPRNLVIETGKGGVPMKKVLIEFDLPEAAVAADDNQAKAPDVKKIQMPAKVENGKSAKITSDKDKKEKVVKTESASATAAKDAKAKVNGTQAPPTPDAALSDPAPNLLDFRVGRILTVQKHASAETLYVESVDVGEQKPRTVVSGLVKHLKESDLQGKLGVFLCNLPPMKLKGVNSEAMLLAATSPEDGLVELLEVPSGCKPGDVIWFDLHKGSSFTVLNPKAKVWESTQPHLRTDSLKRATFSVVKDGIRNVSIMRTEHGEVTVKSNVLAPIK